MRFMRACKVENMAFFLHLHVHAGQVRTDWRGSVPVRAASALDFHLCAPHRILNWRVPRA